MIELDKIMSKSIYIEDDSLSEKEYLEKNYLVTKEGRVFRKYDGREIVSCLNTKGYLQVRLANPKFSKNIDGRKCYRIHRLVAMFYLDDYSEDLQVNHKNGDKTDNRVENLEMVTNQQNVLHAWNVLDSSSRREKIREKAKHYDLKAKTEKSAEVRRKITLKIDKDGKILEVFDGRVSAGKSMGITPEAISYAVKNKTICAGFYWETINKNGYDIR